MRHSRGNAWGLALIVLGGLWLLRELGVLPDVSLWSLFWLGLGAWLLAETARGRRRGWFWPLGFIAAGLVLLLRDLDVIDKNVTVWPVVLIVLGLSILAGAGDRRRA